MSSRPTSAIEPSTTSVPSAVPSTGAMKPSPQGRLPKAPRLPSSPASTIASRPSRPSRRSLPWGQVMRASAPPLRAGDDRPAAAARPRRGRWSSAGVSISSVTPGRRADAHARLARRLAGGGVGERLDRRRQDHVGRGHRGGDRARRLGGGESRSEITARVASAPSPCASIRISAPISSVTGLQTTSTSSPGETPMHSRTTVRTALSSSAVTAHPTHRNSATAACDAVFPEQ